jgi:methylmalonyl-CoA mutase N-terminal domain/subunit
MIGVNRYVTDKDAAIPLLRIDEEAQKKQIADLATLKAGRDPVKVRDALESVRAAATGTGNLMPPIILAAKAYATQQEICDVLRAVFGTHSDPAEF